MSEVDLRFGSAIVTAEGVFVAADDAYCMLLGQRRDELIGRHFIERVEPAQRRRSLQSFQELVRTGVPRLSRRRLLTGSGRTLDFDVSASCLPRADGSPPLICAVNVPVGEAIRRDHRREELVGAIGSLASDLRTLVSDHQLDDLATLLDMVALECRTQQARALN